MTDPTPPTPGAPATEPTAAPATATPAAPAPTPAPATTTFDPSSLSPEAQAWLKSQVEAADLKARTGSKANAAKEAREAVVAEVAKALGLKGDQPIDPEALVAQVEQAQNDAWAAAVELQVYRVAASVGADPDGLLDSVAFLGSLDELGELELDPRSDEFAEKLKAKVQAAAAKYPAKAGTGQAPAGPRPDPTQGARTGAVATRPTSLTQAVGEALKKR